MLRRAFAGPLALAGVLWLALCVAWELSWFSAALAITWLLLAAALSQSAVGPGVDGVLHAVPRALAVCAWP